MRTCFISFETKPVPSDDDTDRNGDRLLFARIVAGLQEQGYRLTLGPSKSDVFGWYADFDVDQARLTCMMQRADAGLLAVFADQSFKDWLQGRNYKAEVDRFSAAVLLAVEVATGLPAMMFGPEVESRGKAQPVLKSDGPSVSSPAFRDRGLDVGLQ